VRTGIGLLDFVDDGQDFLALAGHRGRRR
jgi:hypothetical protein